MLNCPNHRRSVIAIIYRRTATENVPLLTTSDGSILLASTRPLHIGRRVPLPGEIQPIRKSDMKSIPGRPCKDNVRSKT